MNNQRKNHSILKVLLIILALIFITSGCENGQNKSPQLVERTQQTRLPNEAASAEDEELGVIVERNVPVPMRDGTILRADVHRPDRGGPYPVIVRRTPYDKTKNFDHFVKAGYIVVSQDARGRYESEGTFKALFTPREQTHDAEDGYDTIQWAARLPNSNGKVGTFGTSYDAILQWRLAPLRPPALVAMSACSIMAHFDNRQGMFRPQASLSLAYCRVSPME